VCVPPRAEVLLRLLSCTKFVRVSYTLVPCVAFGCPEGGCNCP